MVKDHSGLALTSLGFKIYYGRLLDAFRALLRSFLGHRRSFDIATGICLQPWEHKEFSSLEEEEERPTSTRSPKMRPELSFDVVAHINGLLPAKSGSYK